MFTVVIDRGRGLELQTTEGLSTNGRTDGQRTEDLEEAELRALKKFEREKEFLEHEKKQGFK